MKPSLFKRIVFAFITLVILIVSMEFIFRGYLALVGFENYEPVVPISIGRFDSKLGWALRPLSVSVSTRTGYRVEYKINSKGLRDYETTYENTKNLFRILLLGDSFTFGFGVPIEKHYSTIIEGYFNDVEAINMGVSGYGIDQELLFFKWEGVKYRPNLVIAFIGDYWNNRHLHTKQWSKEKPRFLLKNNELVLTNSPVSQGPLFSGPLLITHRYFKKNIMLYRQLYIFYTNGFSLSNLLFINKPGEKTLPAQFERDEKELEEGNKKTELYTLGEAIIKEMKTVSANIDASFLLVTLNKDICKMAIDDAVKCLNVGKALRSMNLLLPDELGHLNEAGNGVLAWEITKFISKHNLIPEKNRKK